MKVALIGARGQFGTDVMKAKPGDVELISLTREELDITNRDSVKEIIEEIEPDTVINTAAYVRVDNAEDAAEEAFKVNAIGAKNLAQVCQGIKTTLLHISTDYVFDGCKKPIPYNEEDVPNPINVYGISKYAGEIFVQTYTEKYYIVRTASLYGKAGASGKGGNFIYTILKRAKVGETMRVVDDTYMSPTYTLDAAKEIWKLILEERPCGIYHITNSDYCSWYEFAKKILEFSKVETNIIPVSHTEYKTKARRPLWTPLVSVRGVELRDWKPALEEFIKEVME
jgi:dTDP-4-dehydrorhamnose reductase